MPSGKCSSFVPFVPVLFQFFRAKWNADFPMVLDPKRRCSNCSSFFQQTFLYIRISLFSSRVNKWNNRRNAPRICGFRLFQFCFEKWNKIFQIGLEHRENAGNVCSNFFGTKWNNNTLSTSPFPCTQSIKRIERSEMQVVLLHSFQNVLKAVLGHRKARRVTSTSSGLKRLKTQNTMSEKRKGDTLKGIPKSIHKRELILDEEEFDASSSGGGEESRTPVQKQPHVQTSTV